MVTCKTLQATWFLLAILPNVVGDLGEVRSKTIVASLKIAIAFLGICEKIFGGRIEEVVMST